MKILDKDNSRDKNNPYFSNYKIYKNSNEKINSNEMKTDYEISNVKKNIQLSDLEGKADFKE